MTSTSAFRSSTVTIAYGLPEFFDTLRLTWVIMPQILTWRSIVAVGLRIHHLGDGGLRLSCQDSFETIERVVGDVEADHVAFERELLLLLPFRSVGNRHGEARLVIVPAESGEQIELAVGLLTFDADDRVDGLLMDLDE